MAEEDNPVGPIDENQIFRSHERQQRLVSNAKEQTKKVRRADQRTRLGLKNSAAHIPRQPLIDATAPIISEKVPADQRGNIEAFDMDDE